MDLARVCALILFGDIWKMAFSNLGHEPPEVISKYIMFDLSYRGLENCSVERNVHLGVLSLV